MMRLKDPYWLVTKLYILLIVCVYLYPLILYDIMNMFIGKEGNKVAYVHVCTCVCLYTFTFLLLYDHLGSRIIS